MKRLKVIIQFMIPVILIIFSTGFTKPSNITPRSRDLANVPAYNQPVMRGGGGHGGGGHGGGGHGDGGRGGGFGGGNHGGNRGGDRGGGNFGHRGGGGGGFDSGNCFWYYGMWICY